MTKQNRSMTNLETQLMNALEKLTEDSRKDMQQLNQSFQGMENQIKTLTETQNEQSQIIKSQSEMLDKLMNAVPKLIDSVQSLEKISEKEQIQEETLIKELNNTKEVIESISQEYLELVNTVDSITGFLVRNGMMGSS